MRYGSVCSGIEAATAAWHPLGWEPAFFSEIEAFPRAVLAHHYPDVPLHGDFTTIGADDYGTVELLVGGTPCQSFSIAGLRKGLDDERGNLSLEFLRLAQRKRPTWLVWENVPGVLSSGEGRDFGAFLGGLVELGYGFAYRVLDAQYFGVPQRRRRVFVVGYSGDWRPPAAVLFERHSLQGHPEPLRKAGQESAADVAPSLTASGRGVERTGESRGQDPVVAVHRMRGFGDYAVDECASALKSRDAKDAKDATDLICFPTNATGEGAESAGDNLAPNGRGHHNPPAVAFKPSHYTRGKDGAPCETVPPLSAEADKGDQDPVVAYGQPVDTTGYQGDRVVGDGDIHPALSAQGGNNGGRVGALTQTSMAVRRLTPRECERLQGFPDDYTAIPYRGKPADQCPDGPRYKALGNSMAVPVMRWIGERIQMVESLAALRAEQRKRQRHGRGKRMKEKELQRQAAAEADYFEGLAKDTPHD